MKEYLKSVYERIQNNGISIGCSVAIAVATPLCILGGFIYFAHSRDAAFQKHKQEVQKRRELQNGTLEQVVDSAPLVSNTTIPEVPVDQPDHLQIPTDPFDSLQIPIMTPCTLDETHTHSTYFEKETGQYYSECSDEKCPWGKE